MSKAKKKLGAFLHFQKKKENFRLDPLLINMLVILKKKNA